MSLIQKFLTSFLETGDVPPDNGMYLDENGYAHVVDGAGFDQIIQSGLGSMTVTLTSAELLTLATDPVTIVPAAGGGKILVPREVYGVVEPGGTGYTNPGTLELTSPTANVTLTNFASALAQASTPEISRDAPSNITTTAASNTANVGLTLTATENLTGGNGAAFVTVTYVILDPFCSY